MTCAIVLILAGCGTLGGGGRDRSPGTLEEALATLVPMPFEDDDAVSDQDRADAAAAAAAAGEAGRALFAGSGDPLLRPGLILKASVMVGDKQEVPETRVQISDAGDVTLPMIGKVAGSGLTLPEFKTKLSELYGHYYRDPDVSVSFFYDERSDSPWGKILVQGRVRNEGWVNIPPTRNMTVTRAIQLAGGFDTSAKKNAVLVTRRRPDGTLEQIRVDLLAIGRRGEIERDIALEPGDVVFVPESRY